MITIELTEREKDILLIGIDTLWIKLGWLDEYVEEEAAEPLYQALLSLKEKTAHLKLSNDIDLDKYS